MTPTERKATEAITRCSGPVMRPTSELVAYAHVLELLADNVPLRPLREYVAPHWADVLEEMEEK